MFLGHTGRHKFHVDTYNINCMLKNSMLLTCFQRPCQIQFSVSMEAVLKNVHNYQNAH
jgi:hypothetical protein